MNLDYLCGSKVQLENGRYTFAIRYTVSYKFVEILKVCYFITYNYTLKSLYFILFYEGSLWTSYMEFINFIHKKYFN